MWNEQYKTLLPPIDTVFNLTSANVVFVVCLVLVAADAIQEELMMMTNLYYYGQQSLILIHKLPFWWIPCNAMGVFLIASVLAFMGSGQRGWKPLLVPSIISTHTMNVPSFISILAGLSALVLAGLVVYGIAHVLGMYSLWKHKTAVP